MSTWRSNTALSLLDPPEQAEADRRKSLPKNKQEWGQAEEQQGQMCIRPFRKCKRSWSSWLPLLTIYFLPPGISSVLHFSASSSMFHNSCLPCHHQCGSSSPLAQRTATRPLKEPHSQAPFNPKQGPSQRNQEQYYLPAALPHSSQQTCPSRPLHAFSPLSITFHFTPSFCCFSTIYLKTCPAVLCHIKASEWDQDG